MKMSMYLLTIFALLIQPVLAYSRIALNHNVDLWSQAPIEVIRYVKPGGDGNQCLTWANACGLQTALSVAQAGDEIWVAEGIYHPGVLYDRSATFSLRDGVALYGGFDGTETARENRDWVDHETVLSGDFANQIGNNSQNNYHVVSADTVDANAVLDGFTITGGNADTSPAPTEWGGGIYVKDSYLTIRNVHLRYNSAIDGGGVFIDGGGPVLVDVEFFQNNAILDGGGLHTLHTASPVLINAIFFANTAGEVGGGMDNTDSSPELSNITFYGNSAYFGGGMFNSSNGQVLTNVTFSGNTASAGGGMINSGDNLGLVNVLFSGNSADFGGGLYTDDSSLALTNVTFSGNTAFYGGGLFSDGELVLTNTILWGNSPDQISDDPAPYSLIVRNSDIQGGCPSGAYCVQVINADPLFFSNPIPGEDGLWGTDDDDYGDLRLKCASPAIDAGNNSAVPSGTTHDRLGNPRFVDIASVVDTGNGSSPIVDMGAYEAQFFVYLAVLRK